MNLINTSGQAYISHTKIDGVFMLRLVISGLRTQKQHIEQFQELLVEKLQMVVLKQSSVNG
ncbi:MAG: hypothetical protein FH748_03015 [Balneolaceae bacterium]|nr:hypothetical protein [Balneolaceae bacterium]